MNKTTLFRGVFVFMSFAFVLTLIFCCFFTIYEINEVSMEPTLKDGEKVVMLVYKKSSMEVKRDDVIVFDAMKYIKRTSVIKRVIGLPGDTVEIRTDGKIYVNNRYKEDAGFEVKEELKTKVEKDRYFVMGDNRPESLDSRKFGTISIDEIDAISSDFPKKCL